MKSITLNTAKIIIGYLALVFALAFLFTSCSSSRHDERAGCFANKHYVGYGDGHYRNAGHASKRSTY